MYLLEDKHVRSKNQVNEKKKVKMKSGFFFLINFYLGGSQKQKKVALDHVGIKDAKAKPPQKTQKIKKLMTFKVKRF